MNSQDRDAFGKMLAMLGEYYSKEITENLLEIYWQGLERFDIQDVRRAFNKHVANADTGQFMPKIADVVKFIEGNKDTAAMEAWSTVARAIREHGVYKTVVFNDEIIHEVITEMGGWPVIGMITDEELPFRIKEFERRYQACLLRGVDNPPAQLTGIFDIENFKKGEKPFEPVMIGFTSRKQISH